MPNWNQVAGVFGALALLVACSSDSEEAEQATLSVSVEYIDDVAVGHFSATVPDGATNITIWFGDGATTDNDLTPSHTYSWDAPYTASLFYDDPTGGGRANVEVPVAGLPVPYEALALPEAPGTYLVALNAWGFTLNQTPNEPAYTHLIHSEAFAFERSETSDAAVTEAEVIYYPTGDRQAPQTVSLTAESARAYVALDDPHQLVAGWRLDGATLSDGGALLPGTLRTSAPEPNVSAALANAEIPADETLDLRLQFGTTGDVDAVIYTLIGPEGSYQDTVVEPDGVAPVQIDTADLAGLGTGVGGLFVALYNEQVEGDVTMRTVNIGYLPVSLTPTRGWFPEP